MSNTFELTEEHIKLLSHAYVSWCGDEYGAPEIDPKRPYGNSGVVEDVCEILEWKEQKDLMDDCFYESAEYESLCDKVEKLHKETETALQIILRSQSFEPGTFEQDTSWSEWERV